MMAMVILYADAVNSLAAMLHTNLLLWLLLLLLWLPL